MLPAVERQLGARLAAVLRLVPRASRVVADVGCDHFQLGMALALDDARGSRLVTRVIGVDKAAAPLEVARRGLGRLPGATRGVREGGVVEVGGRVLELRLGDGLRAMSKADGVDCVAIAGMGTRNMVEEVLAGPAAGEVLGGVRHLVLQVRPAGPALAPSISSCSCWDHHRLFYTYPHTSTKLPRHTTPARCSCWISGRI